MTLRNCQTACGVHAVTLRNCQTACGVHAVTLRNCQTASGVHAVTLRNCQTARGVHAVTLRNCQTECGSLETFSDCTSPHTRCGHAAILDLQCDILPWKSGLKKRGLYDYSDGTNEISIPKRTVRY